MIYSALTHGISEHVGSVEVGRVADLVMWDPANFGVRPKNVIKGGVIAWAQVGDANAVSDAPLDNFYFGIVSATDATYCIHSRSLLSSRSTGDQCGLAIQRQLHCVLMLSFQKLRSIQVPLCLSDEAARWKLTDFVWPGSIESYRLSKKAIAVKGCRTVGKKDMKWNAEMPSITVDPETYRVEADGVHMTVEAATRLPLTQGYMLF